MITSLLRHGPLTNIDSLFLYIIKLSILHVVDHSQNLMTLKFLIIANPKATIKMLSLSLFKM